MSHVDHSGVWEVWVADPGSWRRHIEHHMFEKGPFYRLILDRIRRCPQRPARVLEVGCGSGIDSYALAARSGAVHDGLDASEASVRLARRLRTAFRSEVAFELGDACRMPYPDATFDVVFSQGLLEHFEDPRPLIEEQVRVVRPGGSIVIDVPQRYSLYTVLKHRQMRRGTWRWGWEREYSAAEMRALAGGHAMELECLGSWGYDFYTGLLRWPLVKLARRNPYRNTRWARRIERWHDRLLAPAIDAVWGLVERPLGPYFMMNITGVYTRSAPAAGAAGACEARFAA